MPPRRKSVAPKSAAAKKKKNAKGTAADEVPADDVPAKEADAVAPEEVVQDGAADDKKDVDMTKEDEADEDAEEKKAEEEEKAEKDEKEEKEKEENDEEEEKDEKEEEKEDVDMTKKTAAVNGVTEKKTEDADGEKDDTDVVLEDTKMSKKSDDDIEACMDESIKKAGDKAESTTDDVLPTPAVKIPEEKSEYEEDEKEETVTPIAVEVGMNPFDTTLNCTVSEGMILNVLPGDGFQNLLAGVRANVGVNKGRYYVECQLLNVVKQGIDEIRFGVSTLDSHLCLCDDKAVCFDSTGQFYGNKKRTHTKSLRLQRHDVMGLLLNLEEGHHNVNTISLFVNGKRHSKPMPLPENMVGQFLFSHVTFKNAIVALNFTSPWKKLPFTVRMIGSAAVEDATESRFVKPVDPEIVIPVGFDTTKWVQETFLPENPTFREVSKEYISTWLEKSDVPTSVGGRVTGLALLEDNGKAVSHLMALRPRNYLYTFSPTLTSKDRAELCARLPGKKTCYVTITEDEDPEVMPKFQDVTMPTVEEGFDRVEYVTPEEETISKIKAWKAKCKMYSVVDNLKVGDWYRARIKEWHDIKDKAQARANVTLAKRAESEKKAEEEKRKRATSEKEEVEKAAAAADGEGEVKKSEEEGEEKKAEEGVKPEDGKVADDAVMTGKDADGEKKDDESKKDGEKNDEEKKEEEKKDEEKKEEAKADEAGENKDAEEEGIDTSDFTDEDWMLAQLRVELHLLVHAFKEDVNDEERTTFPSMHLATYYKMYNYRNLMMCNFECKSVAELCALVPDIAKEEGDLMVALREKDTSVTTLLEDTEKIRQDRVDRIRAGDEGSALKFKAFKPSSMTFDRRAAPDRSWRDDASRRRPDESRYDRREPLAPRAHMPSRDASRDRRNVNPRGDSAMDRRDEPIRRPRVASRQRDDARDSSRRRDDAPRFGQEERTTKGGNARRESPVKNTGGKGDSGDWNNRYGKGNRGNTDDVRRPQYGGGHGGSDRGQTGGYGGGDRGHQVGGYGGDRNNTAGDRTPGTPSRFGNSGNRDGGKSGKDDRRDGKGGTQQNRWGDSNNNSRIWESDRNGRGSWDNNRDQGGRAPLQQQYGVNSSKYGQSSGRDGWGSGNNDSRSTGGYRPSDGSGGSGSGSKGGYGGGKQSHGNKRDEPSGGYGGDNYGNKRSRY
eukprot:GEMP01003051.1.p1 GENE.GEMP01003051.1~~GEMP01003051.1.p1  ORF type:complete len:1173 (+),score=378.10 GEMP01003051.1:92-3610(+)